jgi:ribA/ribD-fused uncharacterized protein
MPDAMPQAESVQKLAMRFDKKWATAGRHLENLKENAMQVARLQRHYSCLSAAGFWTPMKTLHDTAAPSRGRTKSNGEIISKNGESAPAAKAANGEAKIWEAGHVGKKPRYLVASKSVINLKSEFKEKLLCDGPTFTAGHSCTFSCAFCYVADAMRKNSNLNALLEFQGLRHEDVVVEIDDPITAVRETLLRKGQPHFADKNDRRIIYGSPLVDVAGIPKQAEVTVAICREILTHTHWQIRLLSKSHLLANVAKELSDYKERMIYGFSTGTLSDEIARSIEIGTPSVSERLKALRELQAGGFRTFGMLCPILPQADYAAFVAELEAMKELAECEHVWAEVLNHRGDAFPATSDALRKKGFKSQADLLDAVGANKAAWNKYAMETYRALASVIPAKKLRFLQYVGPDDFPVWAKYQSKGAVLLGTHAKVMNEVLGRSVELPELIAPLSKDEKRALEKHEAVIQANVRQFVAVGLALKAIRDEKLYRQTHSSFEAYCMARFDFGGNYGHRLIKSASVVEGMKPELELLPIGNSLVPTTESQVRELLKVPEGDRVKVLKRAAQKTDKKPVSAYWIQVAAAEVAAAESKSAPVALQEGNSYFEPTQYTTDQKVFLKWLETLKSLATRDEKDELLRLLEKAVADKAILPEMTDMVLIRAVGEMYGALGNMSDHPIDYKRDTYLTSEALFQVLRFDGFPEVQEKLKAQKSPMGVKMIAKKHRRKLERPDSELDLEIMRLCLQLKAEQHDDVKKVLLATSDKMIVEDCTARPRGDAFYWGMANINGQWVGENWLGKLWMELREKIQP